MLVDIQYHPVKDTPMHADFKRIDVAKPVNVSVPINLLNQESSKGLKMGGANDLVPYVALPFRVEECAYV